MKINILYLILSLIFIGCSPKSFIALSDNNKNGHNAIVIKTNGGSIVLNKAGSYITLNSIDDTPENIKYMPPKELKKKFAMLYENMPRKPRSYIVFFKPNSIELTEKSKRTLQQAIKEIRDSSPCIVDIIGHTNTIGSFQLNSKLSINRADYIKHLILQHKNIKITKLCIKGDREDKIFVKTLHNISKPKNRSVEIFIR